MTETVDPAAWHRDGYAIVRGFFTPDEVAAIGADIDGVHAEGVAHGPSLRHGNLFYKIAQGGRGPVVQMVQWPSYHRPVLDAVRLDPRFAALLEPLIGRDIKQIINQIHWKAPGAVGDFAWHQDRASACRPNAIATSALLRPDRPRDRSAQARIRRHALRAAQPSHGDLDLDTDTDVLGNAMQRRGARTGRAVGRRCDRARTRSRRSRALESLSGPRIGAQPIGPPAPLLHQRLCPRRGLRPRRMGVPRRPAGAAGAGTGAGALRGAARSGASRIMCEARKRGHRASVRSCAAFWPAFGAASPAYAWQRAAAAARRGAAGGGPGRAPASAWSCGPRTAASWSRSLPTSASSRPPTPSCSPPRPPSPRFPASTSPTRPAAPRSGWKARGSGAPDVVLEGHGDARLSSAPDCVVELPRGARRRGGRANAPGPRRHRRRQLLPRPALEPGDELEQHRRPAPAPAISALTLDDNELHAARRAGRAGPAAGARPAALLRDRQSRGDGRGRGRPSSIRPAAGQHGAAPDRHDRGRRRAGDCCASASTIRPIMRRGGFARCSRRAACA